PDVFAWYIKNYGADVNLFVDHSQIVQLECLRAGIWGTKSGWGRVVTYKEKQASVAQPFRQRHPRTKRSPTCARGGARAVLRTDAFGRGRCGSCIRLSFEARGTGSSH